MHIGPPPFLLNHSCAIMVYPAFLACDVIISQSILLFIQVSVMMPMSILSTSIWCRTMSNLLMIDCILVKKNLVFFLPFQYIMLCLGIDFSHSSCTPLFWSCIFGLFFPPLVPLNVLFKSSPFIFKHVVLSRFVVYLFLLILSSCPEVYEFRWSMFFCSTCPVSDAMLTWQKARKINSSPKWLFISSVWKLNSLFSYHTIYITPLILVSVSTPIIKCSLRLLILKLVLKCNCFLTSTVSNLDSSSEYSL